MCCVNETLLEMSGKLFSQPFVTQNEYGWQEVFDGRLVAMIGVRALSN